LLDPFWNRGDVVWDTQTHYLINKIENVQSEAARIATGGTKLTSIQKLYESCIGLLNNVVNVIMPQPIVRKE
jgi:hypothetical protein